MNNTIKKYLKRITPPFILEKRSNLIHSRYRKRYLEGGCQVPPPHLIKSIVIKEYQKRFKYALLVETGTYLGHMVEAQKRVFKKIISIELSEQLYRDACVKFENDSNVYLYQGDSGEVLPQIVSELTEPAIFWLDGHYSGGVTAMGKLACPILEELNVILGNKKMKHVLLIDDARLFTGKNDYPTIEELKRHIKNLNNKYTIEIKYDIIRCVIV